MANKEVDIVNKTAIVNVNSPKALKTFSVQLKRFIVDNELYTTIGKKNYVHVEGWQFAGASMGIFPVVEKVERINTVDSKEVKYRAEVKLIRLSDGSTVGYGMALCSNSELKKKSFDEYAIMSMAQTRAVGKAFRLTVGWLMKLAGYEGTPSDEMSSVEATDEQFDAIVEAHRDADNKA